MASKIKLHPKLQKLRSSIETRHKITDVFVQPSFQVPYINTGSTVLNMLVGGSRLANGAFVCPGWPKGKIVEIYGRESSGKSTIALTAMGHTVTNGGCGLYVDLECAVIDAYAMKLGVDFRGPEEGGPGTAMRCQPHSFEETETIINAAALNGIDIIVVDSVAGLVSEREINRDVSDKDQKQGIAEIPRLMAGWMPKLQRIIASTDTLVIFLNQTRDKIGAIGFSEEAKKTTTGGNALKFWAAIRMLLKPKNSTKAKVYNPITKSREDVQIATDVQCKVIKNKIDATQGHAGMITIRYGVGIDELRTMMNVAEAYGIIKKEKNKKRQDVFKLGSTKTDKIIEATGIEKFRLELIKSGLLEEMVELSKEKIVQGFQIMDDEQLAALAEDAVTKENDDYDDDSQDDYVVEHDMNETEGTLEGDEGLEPAPINVTDINI
jgi:recombination protein RecA